MPNRRAPSTALPRGPPPPLRCTARGRISESFPQRLHAPELCSPLRRHFQKRLASGEEGSGAPKGACQPSPLCRQMRSCARVCVRGGGAPIRGAPAFRRYAAALARANASAVGSAPVPAFPETRSNERYPFRSVSSLPSSSETGRHAGRAVAQSRPGADGKSARRHRPRSAFRHAFRKSALHERGDGVCNRNEDRSQKNVASNVTCSAGRIWIAKSAYTSRTGGLLGSTSLSSIGATPMMPMTAGSLPPFFTPS